MWHVWYRCVAMDVSTEVPLKTIGIAYGTISRRGHTDNRRDERNNENVSLVVCTKMTLVTTEVGVNLGFNFGEDRLNFVCEIFRDRYRLY